MHNLLDFLQKYHHWFLFVFLEVISGVMLFKYNSYQGSVWLSSANVMAGKVYEIESGEEYAFTGDREQQIVSQNADYYETPNVVSLFEDHFRKPEAGDEVLLMSPTEIVTALKLNPENHSNVTLLGLYLRRKGFEHGDGRQRRLYKIAANSQ